MNHSRKVISLLVVALFGLSITAKSQISAGGLAITSFNADGDDEFSFVLLEGISGTTEVYFTDNGWDDDADGAGAAPTWGNTSEGTLTWTFTGALPAGTEIQITTPSGTESASQGTVVRSGTWSISGTGDAIIAYRGTGVPNDGTEVTEFIWAFNSGSAGWTSNSTATTTSGVPTGLTDGVNAIDFGSADDNFQYDCSVTTPVASLRTALATEANFTLGSSDENFQAPGCSYLVACVAPTAQATSVVFGSETSTTIDLTSWTAPAGGATGYVVFVDDDNTSFSAPTDGTSPAASTTYVGTSPQVVYNGTSASPSLTVSGLTASTTYYFQIYSYNDCSGTETYETTGLNANDVTGAAGNSAPVATAPSSPTVNEDDTNVALADDIDISDVDGDDQTLTFTITGGTVTLGTTSITFGGSGNGSSSFTAAGTLADLTTALDAATFTPTNNLNGTNAGTIAFVSNDGTGDGNTASVTFDIIAVNDAPSISDLNGDALNPYTEGDGPQNIDQGTAATLTDIDSPADLDGGNLTVTISAGEDAAEDLLSFNTANVTLSGTTASSTVTVSATNIGTIDNAISEGNDLVVTFNSNATLALVEELIQNITYENTDTGNPTAGARTIRVTVDDNDGGTSTSSNNDVTITVVGANDLPVATAPSSPTVNEDDTNVALADDIDISDVDGDDQTLTFTITGGTVTLGTTSITFGGSGNGSASFTAQGTLVNLNTALDAATFTPTNNLNGTNAGTIAFVSNDGTGDGNTASVTFDIIAVNDAPSISDLNGDALNPYTEGDGPQNIDQGTAATLTDIDSPADLDGGNLTVTISAGEDAAEDLLSFNTANVTLSGTTASSTVTVSATNIGTIDNAISEGNDLVVTFNSNATLALVEELIQNITYENTDTGNPTAGARTIRVTVDDNDGGTSTSSNNDVTVTVVGANDLPVATAPSSPTVNEDDTNVALADDIDISDVDGDDQTLTFTITGGTVTLGTTSITFGGSGNGSASFTAQGTLVNLNTALDAATFTPTNNLNGTNAGTIAFVSNDGTGDGNTASVTFDIIAVNDAPSISDLNGDALNPYTEGDGPQNIDQGTAATLTDIDSPADLDGGNLTVTISAGEDAAEDLLSFNTANVTLSGTTASSTVTVSATNIGTIDNAISEGNDLVVTFNSNATLALVEELIQNITYENTDTGNPTAGARTIRVTVDDNDGGTSTSSNNDVTITVIGVNDAPTSADNMVTAEEDVEFDFVDGNFPFTDAAEGDAFQQIYIITLPATGTLEYNNVAAMTGTGTSYTDRALFSYNPLADENGTSYTTFTFQVVDDGGTANSGVNNSATQTMTIDVTAINDEPSIDATAGNQAAGSGDGLQTVALFIDPSNDITFGPTDENGQVVSSFAVSIDSDPNGVINGAVAISNAGELTYTPNSNTEGTAVIDVQVVDDGGTAGTGADNTSAVVQFSITISDNEGPLVVAPATTDFTPADGSSGITVVGTTELQIIFDQDVTATAGEFINIFNDSGPVLFESIEATNSAVTVTNNVVDIVLSDFLEKDQSYYVQIDADAFRDLSAGTNGFAGISNTTTWNWDMEATGSPNVISSSPLDNATNVPISTVLQFIFDEPVRYANGNEGGNTHSVTITSSDVGDTDFPATFSTLSGNDGSTINDNQDAGFSPSSTTNNVSVGDVISLDITNADTPISFKPNTTYTVDIGQGAFEFATGSEDNPAYSFDFTTVPDATPPSLVGDGTASFEPDDQTDFTRSVDASSLTQLDIIFDEDVQAGIGNIELHVDTNDDGSSNGIIFDIASDNAAISYIASSLSSDLLRIDLSSLGISLSGNLTYFINIDNGAIEDLFSNSYAGISDGSTWNFSTLDNDVAIPTLVSITPSDNSTNVLVSTTELELEFDEPIQGIAGKLITLRLLSNSQIISSIDLDGSTPGSSIAISGVTATIGLPVSLSSLTQYYVTVEDGAFTDFAGTPNEYGGITSPSEWNFTTESSDDGNGSLLSSTNPSDGATDVSLTPTIEIQFDEQIFEGTGNITLTGGSATITIPVSGTNITGSRVEIPLSASTPTATTSLEYGVTYEVNVPLGAYADINGNDNSAIVGSSDWSFTTEADMTAPVITPNTPADDAVAIAITNPSIIIDFDEDVDLANGDVQLLRASDLVAVATLNTTTDAASFTGGGTSQITAAFSVTLSQETEYFVLIKAGAFEDTSPATNANTVFGGSSADWSFTTVADGIAPTLTITRQAATNGNEDTGTSDTEVKFDLVFSEPIDDATFSATADITVNATGTTFTALSAGDLVNSGDDTNYELTIQNVGISVSGTNGTIGVTVGPNIEDQAVANNNMAAAQGSTAFVIDQSGPTIGGLGTISLGTDNPVAYTGTGALVGDMVQIGFTASETLLENPTVQFLSGDNPNLGLTNGTVTIGGSAPNYTATYTVSDLDNSGDVYFNIEMTDLTGNTSSFTSVPAGVNVTVVGSARVDAEAPEVESITLTPVTSGTTNSTNQNSLEYTIVFSEGVRGSSFSYADDIELTGAGVTVGGATLVPEIGNVTWTLTLTGITGNGTLGFNIINNGVSPITDGVGNTIPGTGTVATTNETITFDNTIPTATITASAPSTGLVSNTNADAISYSIVFSEAIDDNTFGLDDITLSNPDGNVRVNGVAPNNLVASAPSLELSSTNVISLNNSGDNTNYTLTIGNASIGDGSGIITGNGDLGISISSTGIQDAADNFYGGGTGANFTIDNLAPTVETLLISSGTAPTDHARLGEVITLTMDFDDNLSSAPSVSFRSGSVPVQETAVVNGSDDMWTASYTVNAADFDGEVDFTLSYTDDAGNNGSTLDKDDLTAGTTVEKDKAAPALTSVSISSSNSLSDHAVSGNTITLSFTINDDLSATPTVDFTSGSSTVADNAGVIVDNTGNDYTATYVVDGSDDDGTVGFTINFIDDAGAPGTAVSATTDDSSVEVDKVGPTLSNVSLSTNNTTDIQHGVAGNIVTLTFDIDDDLSASASLPSVAIQSGNVDVTDAEAVRSTGANSYEATYTVNSSDTDGAVSFEINYTDDAGNVGATVTTGGNPVEIDKLAPTIESLSISSGTAPTDHARLGEVITLTMDFDDDLASAPTVSFRSGSVPVQEIPVVNGADDVWTAVYTVDTDDFDGDVDFTVTFTDDAGNAGTALDKDDLTSGTTVEIDKVKPTVTFTDTMEDPSNTSPVVVTATFDEDVTDFTGTDLAITNGTLSSLSGSNDVYTINITPNSPLNDSITVQLNNMSIIDDAGNSNDPSSIYYVDYDNIAPVITSTSIVQGRELTLTTQLDEPGTVYYVVVADGISVTSAEVVGVSGAAATPVASGSVTFTTGGINIVESIALDADRTDYELYLVSEDNVDSQNQLSAPEQISIKSGGVTINTPSITDICLEGDFFEIGDINGDIILSETIATDFNSSSSNRTIVLELPENFVFQDAGNVTVNTGSEVSIVSSTNNTAKTTLTITYTVSAEAVLDVITISSLEVQASGTITGTTQLTRTGGNGDVYGINDENTAIPAFAQLTTIAPFNAPSIVESTPTVVSQPYILETDSLILGDFLGDGVTVYNKDDFDGSSTPLIIGTVNASDNVNIYSNEDLNSLVLNLNGSSTHEPSLSDLGLTDASVGVNTFWITTTDGNSCESAATKYSIAIIRLENSASTTTFSDSDQNGGIFKFSFPTGSSAVFEGNGLTNFNNNNDFTSPDEDGFSVKFLPTSAGDGRDTLKYALTNATGETANYWIALLVNNTDGVFADANIGDAGLCSEVTAFSFDVISAASVDANGVENGTGSDPDFYEVRAYYFADNTRGVDVTDDFITAKPTISLGTPTSLSGWELDLDAAQATYDSLNSYSMQIEFVLFINDENTNTISELATEEVTVFRNPTVTFENLTDGNFYCADDELFDIEVEIISASGTITRNIDDNGYLLAKWNGTSYVNVLDSDTISQPARLRFDDLNTGDSTAYRLSYTSAEYTNAGCQTTVESTFTVYPKPEVRNLTLTSELSSRGDLDVDGSYTFEYCEGDTFDGLSIVLSEGDSVVWYRNAALTERIATGVNNGSTVTATELFGSSIEAQGVENETFYYVLFENRNNDFDGCGSDAVAVNYIAYPTPDAPVLSLTSNSASIGTNEFEYNYCVNNGDAATLEDLVLDTDNAFDIVGEDYYKLYRLDDNDTILVEEKVDVQTIVISNYLNGESPIANFQKSFFIERIENDNTQNGAVSTEQFGGCSSSLTKISINVWDIPDAPDQSQFADNPNVVTDVITYYLCAGEQLPDMSIAAPAGINDFLYEWFDANGDLMTVDDNQGDRLVDSDLQLAFGNDFRTTEGTYSMTVQLNANVRDDASFAGCTSPTTRVDLVVLPVSNIPEITAPSATAQSTPNEEFIYCVDFETGLEGSTTFEASVTYTVSAGYSNRIDWYRVNAAGDPVGNLNAAATGASITAFDLGIDGLGAGNSVSDTLNYGIVHTADLVDGYEEFGGCISETKYIQIIVSPIPDPQFGFDGIVEGETTTFTFLDQNSTDIGTDGLVFSITDSDDNVVVTHTSSDLNSFDYVFDDGVYTATMNLTSETGCTLGRVRTFRILENIVIGGVTTFDFNGDDDGGWFTEFQNINGLTGSVGAPDNNSSWSHGAPSGNIIDSDADGGGGAWVTNLSGSYNNGEESFLYSPSYDLTGINNHAVSFESIRNLEDNKDGVVFQLSVDNGDTWITVGDFDGNEATGVNWYNASNISATPGNNKPSIGGGSGYNTSPATNRVGWTDTETNPSWVESVHPLNFPDGSDLSNVRFRFSLNSNANEKTNEGFGIDNFTLFILGKTVLVEQFSSTLSLESKEFQQAIIGEIDRNEVMYINYMTDFASASGRDVLNERNPGGPGARAEYYEVSKEPQTVIDGEVFEQTDDIDWNVSDINLKELSKVLFDINDLQVNSVADNVINASVTFESLVQNDTTLDLSFYFAVVETSVDVGDILDQNPGLETVGEFVRGESILNVLRVMNPSPAGYNYEGVVSNGQEFPFTMNWEVTNVYNVDRLRIIAFVQSNTNVSQQDPSKEDYTGRVRKEVLQSAYVDVTGVAGNALGLEILSNFTIYPNPGDEQVTVEFEEVTRTEEEWIVFDQAGREVLKGIAGVGTKQLTIETKEVPSGIYLFHMYGEDNSRYAKRLIIVH